MKKYYIYISIIFVFSFFLSLLCTAQASVNSNNGAGVPNGETRNAYENELSNYTTFGVNERKSVSPRTDGKINGTPERSMTAIIVAAASVSVILIILLFLFLKNRRNY